jgi:hypothetical protein
MPFSQAQTLKKAVRQRHLPEKLRLRGVHETQRFRVPTSFKLNIDPFWEGVVFTKVVIYEQMQ